MVVVRGRRRTSIWPAFRKTGRRTKSIRGLSQTQDSKEMEKNPKNKKERGSKIERQTEKICEVQENGERENK